ncbi:MAG: 50S ribosomal protein L31 [Candidatus Colwellbacteria bacterium RIFCSPLOWO2_12_FULL_44_13]|uniref:Large ribosomal subunit protein bL31 n=3 Tax=Candidatus Colwelliibacteriota TaxID=1817904 RepID=A0A1G1Z4S3_9BACT|nr:MAG: 50S ribosomal protein L31 [Candidatus Colwellbacteria bacterium RIFCSPHIGHO2_12_FULL_44_17]OGY59605.1 MAG: 50S ribosomal protein L31 [Candidatus Colwellbacteria bacterium RIFCSPLOWO2_02_FULL_44_20b]OGY61852.1 MAG: 50S ribosomal protein L31 [Candidatus Colwellbacteria bacterium RIFCSPLOWO2_12_FULL_44_13]
MKQDIHPQYHTKAEIRCSCGKVFTVGSTEEKMEVEICSNCHPFFTGKEKLLDIAGRVEKFKARVAAKKTEVKSKKEKKAVKKEKKIADKKEA